MSFLSVTRRRVIVAASGIAAALFTPWIGRGSKSLAETKPAPKPTPKPVSGFQPVVGPANILDKHGKVLTDKVLIVRNKEQLVGVSPLCNHRNCVVDWQADRQVFVCPCHGSEFGTDGAILKGPADKPLTAYDVKIEENRFFIKPKGKSTGGAAR